MPSENLIISAAAGAGKTTRIVQEALRVPSQRVLIATYTNNNESEIRKKFLQIHGSVPSNVRIQTWFSFLLEHFVRPYQRALFSEDRVRGLAFVNGRSVPGVPESSTQRHFFAPGPDIFSDKIAKFGVRCNEQTNGFVVGRLEQIFDFVMIDEVQDLAGWDLDILELLFASDLNVTLVGDHRQSTYVTNNAAKYRQYAGIHIDLKFRDWAARSICRLEEMSYSYRCIQSICDFADKCFPDAPDTESRNINLTGHDGVFVIQPEQVNSYIKQFSPKILRYDRRTNCDGHEAINFGESKGLGFERILIYPHGPLRRLLANGEFPAINEPSKLYVALTRAQQSVAFVYDGQIGVDGIIKFDPG